MNSRIPEPCDVPRDDHDGEVHFYVTGWKCDAHSPWAAKGLDRPESGSGTRAAEPHPSSSFYAYRAAQDAIDHENGQAT